MKFIVSSTALLKQLQTISGVLGSNNTLAILDYLLFEIKDGKLTISGSDLETTMTTTLTPEKAEEEGKIAMPARLLLDTVKTFPDQPLTFTIDSEVYGIEISSDNGRYKLSGQDGDEFPKAPEIENPDSAEIESGILFNAINKTIFAAGNDDLRPVMSGVLFEIGEKESTFVATDAHKLVRYKRSDVSGTKASSFIMPKKPLNLIKNITSSLDVSVKMEYNDTNAKFYIDDITVMCRLIDGKYPTYDAVIPKENPNVLTVDRKALLNSVKRVSIFSNKTTHQVRFKMAGSELNISAEDVDYQNEAAERLTASYDGEDMSIGFNSRFLIEMLNNLETDAITLHMSQPNRAGLLIPEETEDNEDVLMLVMPVMIGS